MEKLILFHGTPDKVVVPTYGKGEERRDYGQGFYLTASVDFGLHDLELDLAVQKVGDS